MCEVTVMATLVGAGLQARQQKESADYQAEVDRNNAKLLSHQRSAVLRQGAQDARRVENAGAAAAASLRTAMEAGGIDSSSGSAANAITTSNVNAAIDADRIRANAYREAWGFAAEERDLLASSRFRKQASYLSALGTGIGGIGQAASMFASRRSNRGPRG